MNIAVVGSSRGIGLEFVKQLSEEHDVFAFCRVGNQSLKQLGVRQIVEGCDVTNVSSIENSLKAVGDTKFDWVLIVAGVLTSEGLGNWSDERILNQFQTNSLGAINSGRLFSAHMNEGGTIGLLTSRMGSIADNTSGGMYGYRMSKAALNAGGKSLAEDLKDQGVTVLLLHPGYVKTDMTNHSGLIETEESVQGLRKIMTDKSLGDTGTFWHTNGEELPW